MSTTPAIGLGTQLLLHDGVSTYTAIGFVTEINGPNEERPLVDATHLASAAREYLAGVKDGGEVTLTIQLAMAHATQQAINTVYAGGLTRLFRLIPNGSTRRFAFSALIRSRSFSFPIDGVMTAQLSLKITGDVTQEAHP